MGEEKGPSVEYPRLVVAQRSQLRWETMDLDDLISSDHRARVVWAAVERLDLSEFYDVIAARGSTAGRAAIDPKVLLALWLYAISEGIGSARHLARLCRRDHVYRWICGGIEPNYHTLSDFRVAHGEKLDRLLTQLLAALLSEGVLRLERVAQDGMRVRASAGSKSFRRRARLCDFLAQARAQVKALREELGDNPMGSSNRQIAARERAARHREQVVTRALEEMKKVEELHEQRRPVRQQASEPRTSTTDPQARVMKMGDGGYRPAFNVQYATDTATRLIVGVEVCNDATDAARMPVMLDQIERRMGITPGQYLVDGGFACVAAVDQVERRGVEVYAPVKTRSDDATPYARKPADTDASARWRARMGTAAAKKIYRDRAAVAETVHADQRAWRGVRQFPVRGLPKARCVVVMTALLHNILRVHALR